MEGPVRAGEILAGKYRVERLLGQGGMGVVVAARHVELDDLVALKFLLPQALSVPDAVARFLKEARAAVRIKSEHVARVHDVGQLESGAPYIVMEYLEGSDLAALLRDRGPCAIEDAVDYLAQACEAMANAHAMGIVHRDLKPSNLMVVCRSDGSECVKVLDFGISKIIHEPGAPGSMNMTRSATILGSPSYMSPEQMMSTRDVDGRTDIWALGAILYELLTGCLPFVADTLPAISVMIATQDPPSIRQLRADIPPALEAVVMRCLAKSPDQRFANVGELATALTPFAPPRALVSIERASRVVTSSGSRARGSEVHVPGSGPVGKALTPVNPGSLTPRSGQRTPAPGLDGASKPTGTPTATTGSKGPSATASNWAGGAGAGKGGRTVAASAALIAVVALAAVVLLHRGPGASAVAPSVASAPVAGALSAVPSASPSPPVASASPSPVVSPERVIAPAAASAIEGGAPLVAPPLARPAKPEGTGARSVPGHAPPPVPASPKKSTYDDM